MKSEHAWLAVAGCLVMVAGWSWTRRTSGADVFPPPAKLVEGHPRVMLRPKAEHKVTDAAVSVTLEGKTYTFSRRMPYKVAGP